MEKFRMVGIGEKLGLLLNCDENQWFMFTEYGVKNNQIDGAIVLPTLLEWCTWHGIRTCVLPRRWSIFNKGMIRKMNAFAREHDMLIPLNVLEGVLKEMSTTGKDEVELDVKPSVQNA